jgi:tryptophan-rich sensory protein
MRIAPCILPGLSAIGALMGVAGTAVLAFQQREVTTVFTLYLISNLAWVAVGMKTRQLWLALMNVVYMALAVYGLLSR